MISFSIFLQKYTQLKIKEKYSEKEVEGKK